MPNKSKAAYEEVASKVRIRDDPNLLDSDRRYVASFDTALKEGRFVIEGHGTPLECFLKRGDSDTLHVILGGAHWNSSTPYPSFPRWNFYKMVHGNFLCIDDPTFKLYPKLKVGWFYGNGVSDCRKAVAEAIADVATNLEVDMKNVTIYSYLINTTASIKIGSYLEGCKVVAVNPALDIRVSKNMKSFNETTGIDALAEDPLSRNCVYDALDSGATFLLACNVRSSSDYESQIIPVFEKYSKNPAYGLNKLSDNVYVWLYDAPSASAKQTAHDSADSYELFPMIDYVARCIGTEYEPMMYEFVADVANPAWFEYYMKKRKISELQASP